MKKILLVNGESYWKDYFPQHQLFQKKIQHADWILKDGKLFAMDAEGHVEPDLILWRVGAIKPGPTHRSTLEIIRQSSIPCVNPASALLRGFDRLSMLNEMRECGLPVIPFNAATSSSQLKNVQIPFPFVVKAGNYHGGFGKVLVENEEKWQDVKDLLFITEDYVTIEPYIKYEKDIRYLAIGNKVWAMARKGKFWKANVQTTDFVLMDTDPKLSKQILFLQEHLGTDILAIDMLQDKNGEIFFVEYNDIPGVTGFPDEVKAGLAQIIDQYLK